MAVSASEVERVLVSIADPFTPADQRAAFTKAIEELKEGDGEQLITIAFQLVSSHNPYVVHVGFNFIQHAIKFKWSSLPVQTRVSLRDDILNRIKIGPPPIPQSISGGSSASRGHEWAEPVAGCVAAMAEQEWPQNWPDMAEKLAMLAVQAATPATSIAVICVLRRLVEDVVVLTTVPNPKRRKEMHIAIHASLPMWLRMSVTLFEDVKVDNSESLLVIKHLIGWLAIVVEWAQIPEIEPYVDVMVNHLVRFLSTADHSIYEVAAQCLTAFASRKKANLAEKTIVDTFFRDNVIETLLETANMAAQVAQSNESHYKYLKALCETLTTMGVHLCSVWSSTAETTTRSLPPPTNFGRYMTALSAFSVHPSLYLRSEATNVLVRFASSPVIRKWKEFKQSIRATVSRLPEMVEKTGQPSESPPTNISHYSRMDFDDDVEWAHDFMQYRTRVFNLVKEIVDDHHVALLEMIQEKVLQRVATAPETIAAHEWDGMNKLAKAVLMATFEKNLVEKKEVESLRNIYLQMVHKIRHGTSYTIANEALSVISALSPLINIEATLIEPLLDLIEYLSVSAPEEEKILKRHCISTLIRLITGHETVAKEYWMRMFEVCKRMAANSSQMQSAQIANAIAALSNVVSSVDDQKSLLEIALGPQLEHLQNMQNIFTDVRSFLSHTGFLVVPPASAEEAELHEGVRTRKLLRSTLSAIEGILQKVPSESPVGPIIVPQCATFGRLVRILFELYDPSTLSIVHSSYSTILDLPYSERQTIYCTVGENLEAATGRRATDTRGSIVLAIQFLGEINEACQSILSICASKFPSLFFSLPTLPSILADTTANLSRLPDYRLRYWFKKGWVSFYSLCPPAQYATVIQSLTTILDHAQRRLEQVWSQVSTIDYDSEPTEDELFLEHMTCVLSREVIGFLRTVFCGEVSSGNNAGSKLSALGCYVFDIGGAILSSFVSLSFTALAWRDTQSCVRAIPVAKAIVDKLSESFVEDAAVFAFVSAIQSIRIHGSDEVAIGPLLAIIFHTYAALRPHSPALRNVLTELPDTPSSTIDAFDRRALSIARGTEEAPEKARKEMVKKLLRPIISVTVGEMGRRPVELRPLPPIEKRAKPIPEADLEAIADFFGHG